MLALAGEQSPQRRQLARGGAGGRVGFRERRYVAAHLTRADGPGLQSPRGRPTGELGQVDAVRTASSLGRVAAEQVAFKQLERLAPGPVETRCLIRGLYWSVHSDVYFAVVSLRTCSCTR